VESRTYPVSGLLSPASDKILKQMKLLYFTIFLSLIIAANLLYAQNRDALIFSARSASMANAYTAIEGDIFAPAYNSAGLASLSSLQMALSGSFGFGSMTYVNAEDLPNIRLKNQWQFNYAAVAIPFTLAGIPMAAGLTYHPLYDFNREFTSEGTIPKTYKEEGGIDVYKAIIAIHVNSVLSLGTAFNYSKGSFHDKFDIHGEQSFEANNYSGYSAEIGALFKFSEDFSMGFNLMLPHSLSNDADNVTKISDIPTFANFGISYRPDKRLIIAADFHYRPWSHSDDFNGETEQAKNDYDINSFHIGAEYIYLEKDIRFPIRAGIYTNPHFAKSHIDGDQATGYVFTGGAGLYLGRLTINTAVTFELFNYYEGNLSSEVTINRFQIILDLQYSIK